MLQTPAISLSLDISHSSACTNLMHPLRLRVTSIKRIAIWSSSSEGQESDVVQTVSMMSASTHIFLNSSCSLSFRTDTGTGQKSCLQSGSSSMLASSNGESNGAGIKSYPTFAAKSLNSCSITSMFILLITHLN